MISKASIRSRVHRRVFMDYVAVKIFDRDGNPVGELRIVGLFTSTAFTRSTRTIPYVRRKVDTHPDARGLQRDRTFRQGARQRAGDLSARGIVPDRRRDAVFASRSRSCSSRTARACACWRGATASIASSRCSSIVPRDRARAAVLEAIGQGLAAIYKGRVGGVTPVLSGRAAGARPLHHHALAERGARSRPRDARIRGLNHHPHLAGRLVRAAGAGHEPGKAGALFERYSDAFPAGYRDRYAPSVAIDDIRTIEGLSAERPLGGRILCAGSMADRSAAGLKVWSFGRPIPLSERVPVLENMGFRVVDESTFDIARVVGRGTGVWLHDMMLERADGGALDLRQLKRALESCFLVVMRGVAENDGYNALVLDAGLWWRDVALMRAISRYLRQIRVPFSQDYLWSTMRQHAGLAAQIVALFQARFDPRLESRTEARGRKGRSDRRGDRDGADKVESLDEDRIIRHFVNAVRSAIRTNYLPDRRQRPAQGADLDQVRQPQDRRPAAAAPALRDFRLFAARRGRASALRQGRARRHPLVGPAAGFPHRSPRPREGAAGQERGHRAGRRQGRLRSEAAAGGRHARGDRGRRRRGLQALHLDACSISPTISSDDTIVPPDNVVRHDGDDPYFVVAADKGTATFSDIANAISLERDFWLGDAFASGGSAGYDHKKMGITARGAWEAVKRHFREMDVDIQRRRSRVAGVGDMSGDVFGNGMLLAQHDQARRGLRSSRHLHRSRSRSGQELRRARSACSLCRVRAGRITTRR